MTDPLLIERQGNVEILTLNRPDKLNTLSDDLIAALAARIERLRHEQDVRAVVLTGRGRAFCAGVEMGTGEWNPLNSREFLKDINGVLDDLEQLPQPTIAAINGPAVAGGLELALACTLRVASSAATLGLPEITLGLVAAVGTTYRLPRLIGFGRTLEMALLGDTVDATTAHAWGLVNRVAAPSEVQSTAMELASRLASGPPVATSLVKDALYGAAAGGNSAAQLLEVLSASVNHYTSDKLEGIAAFFEKRPPRFTGR